MRSCMLTSPRPPVCVGLVHVKALALIGDGQSETVGFSGELDARRRRVTVTYDVAE